MTAPFYTTPAAVDGTARRRLLLVSYAFPPDRTVGALRWQKMLSYLHARGWTADVITLRPDTLDAAGRLALAELPPDVRVYPLKLPFPRKRLERPVVALLRAVRRLRPQRAVTEAGPPRPAASPALTAIPIQDVRWNLGHVRGLKRAYFGVAEHAEIGLWAAAAARLGRYLHDQTPYDVIVTSGPPHMAHMAGRWMADRTGRPHVVDMRDPWSLSEQVYSMWASPAWVKLAQRYEGRVINGASLVVANTTALQAAIAHRYPAARRIITITNGADDELLPVPPATRRFAIRYAGTIYTDSDALALFRAVKQATDTLRVTPDEFGIDLIGDFGGEHILSLAAQAGVRAFATVGGHRPRREALAFLAGADVLVTLPGVNPMLTIPAKVFECMRFDAWLLVLAPTNGATAQTLADTGADVVPLEDAPAIASRIVARFEAWRRGERPVALGRDPRFTRRFQANQLADALDALER